MDVSEQVFARKGFHDASLRGIAELAAVESMIVVD
jgi:AcrR family transcriptional regulator